ncbi:hypothetical protein GOBAR_AA21401 [Gossypium barbadense]|uniref:Uncharacterized protein n=1 Tax=Gossypium barbadense TaxID=3634 RepID=A0A2P5X7E8_GOSBA|nr:hypothetical protein GOBAR_AA21401 [Gossypium barbadense]
MSTSNHIQKNALKASINKATEQAVKFKKLLTDISTQEATLKSTHYLLKTNHENLKKEKMKVDDHVAEFVAWKKPYESELAKLKKNHKVEVVAIKLEHEEALEKAQNKLMKKEKS